VKGETLIFCFSLQDAEPNASENQALEKIEAHIDSELQIDSLDEEYFGKYEVTSIDDCEYRMFMSTPDADTLLEKLRPYCRSLDWPGGFRVIKSEGGIHDEHAEQAEVEL